MSWAEQVHAFDLDPHFHSQDDYEAYLRSTRTRRSRRGRGGGGEHDDAMLVRLSGVRYEIGYSLYQHYGSCTFFRDVIFDDRPYRSDMARKKPLSDSSRVSAGYVIRTCQAWKEYAVAQNNRKPPGDDTDYEKAVEEIVKKFLVAADRWYNTDLYRLWKAGPDAQG